MSLDHFLMQMMMKTNKIQANFARRRDIEQANIEKHAAVEKYFDNWGKATSRYRIVVHFCFKLLSSVKYLFKFRLINLDTNDGIHQDFTNQVKKNKNWLRNKRKRLILLRKNGRNGDWLTKKIKRNSIAN